MQMNLRYQILVACLYVLFDDPANSYTYFLRASTFNVREERQTCPQCLTFPHDSITD